MLRVEPEKFRLSRDSLVKALQAEGIPCSAGYGFPLFAQPMFRNKAFGPFLPKPSDRLDYRKVQCPNAELLCREQAIWITQNLLLGPRTDMDDIANAFAKVYENRAALAGQSRRTP
jgi:dTDP-4-amino-4,6-dideoxygalactose transaminase